MPTWPKGCRLLLVVLLVLGACEGSQSTLETHGANAREVARLWWLMFWVTAGAFVLVAAALAAALFAPLRWRGMFTGTGIIIAGGVVLPAIILPLFLIASFTVTWPGAGANPGGITIDVIGHQFWWEVRYPNPDPDRDEPVASANEVYLPVGEPVTFRLLASDVIHSFWIPNLSGKTDMIPGRTNEITVVAERSGIFRGQCAEFCGLQHANMAFFAVALPPEEFDEWLRREAEPAPPPEEPELQRGLEAFVSGGCGSCHTIRGTPAAGTVAPDLTHVGRRLSLAAGLLDNNLGSLAAWIATAQHLKPGNRMPSFTGYDGETLRAVAAYLDSLE